MMNFTFSENLKKLRKKFGFSQNDLAEKLGYSAKNVSKWETNQSIPNVDVLNEICILFKLSNISELINTPIDYYEVDIENDLIYVKKNQIQLTEDDIILYYKLLKNGNFLSNPIDYDLVDKLLSLQKLDILREYTINQSDEGMFVRYKLNYEDQSDRTLKNLLSKKTYENVNFADDEDYYQFIDNLKLPKQVNIVLDYIDVFLSEEFELKDLYDSGLIEKLIDSYGVNRDHKKIIRTCLTKLCELGIISKIGYAIYKKKHHKIIQEIVLDDQLKKKLDSILKLKFDGFTFDREYSLEEFSLLNLNSECLLLVLNNYMIFLRNISLISDFEVELSNDFIKIKYM